MENTWPEQDAVDKWLKKHGIKVGHSESLELKEAVTEYRVKAEIKLKDRERILGHRTKSMEAFLRAYNSLMASIHNVIEQSEDKWTKGYLKQALAEADKEAPAMAVMDNGHISTPKEKK